MRIHPIRSLLIVGGFTLFLVTWLDLLSIPPCAADTLFRLLARYLTTLSYSVAVAYAAYLKVQGFTATVHAYGRAKWRVTVSKVS